MPEYEAARLFQLLQVTGLQNKDFPLWQLLYLMIDTFKNIQAGTGGTTIINPATPTSTIVQQIMGMFDDISHGDSGDGSIMFPPGGQVVTEHPTWDVLTDGDLINPEFVFASGQVVMGRTPA